MTLQNVENKAFYRGLHLSLAGLLRTLRTAHRLLAIARRAPKRNQGTPAAFRVALLTMKLELIHRGLYATLDARGDRIVTGAAA